jgi:hypothetical protein
MSNDVKTSGLDFGLISTDEYKEDVVLMSQEAVQPSEDMQKTVSKVLRVWQIAIKQCRQVVKVVSAIDAI